MFPYAELVEENGLADKPVLLSYRTQQMLLMALSKMENRYAWLEMDDTQWDELDWYIAEAETEVLTEVESQSNMDRISVAHATLQSFTAGIQTAINFQEADNGQDVYSVGDFEYSSTGCIRWNGADEIVVHASASVQISSTVSTSLQLILRHLDDNIIISRALEVGVTTAILNVSADIVMQQNDRICVEVIASAGSPTVPVTNIKPHFSVHRIA